jgi:uncharacterized protein involved in outer membrane biogenesis
MKFLFKWVRRILLLLVVLVVLAVVFKNAIIKTLIQQRLRAQTGMEARIGKLEVGLVSSVIHIENFKLYNNADFGGSVFVSLPEIHVEYDPAALGSRQLHLKLLRLNLAEFNLVRNEAGRTNITELQQRVRRSGRGAGENSLWKFKQQLDFTGIDTLNVSLGKIRFSDLKTPANSWALDLGLQNRVLKNVKSEADLRHALLFALFQDNLAEGVLDLLKGNSSGGNSGADRLRNLLPPPRK